MLWAVLFRLPRAGFDADGVGDASQVAGVTGENGGLVAHGGGDDDGIDDVSGAGGRAGDAGGAPGGLVVGNDVAAFDHPHERRISLLAERMRVIAYAMRIASPALSPGLRRG